ncbi:hypothetical protein [Erwinia amylovora]|uniref:hypothetical protein n=1 Tax=Erwinia amylovora TaxID=552 RepID=UPI001443FDA0|nr:hypothetical protein [Erwinia amylovora]
MSKDLLSRIEALEYEKMCLSNTVSSLNKSYNNALDVIHDLRSEALKHKKENDLLKKYLCSLKRDINTNSIELVKAKNKSNKVSFF